MATDAQPREGLTMITAAADGSALGNPGHAGWAWYVDDDCWAAGGWMHATNNQGELTAVLELFRATAHVDDELLVVCDSQYVINSVTKWMPGWKRKGWRKADGKPVMNVDLLKELDAAIAGRRYRFEWVKGHIGHVLNEAADLRARAAAEAYRSGLEVPSGPGWRVVRPTDAAAPPVANVLPPISGAPTALAEPELDDAALFDFDDPSAGWLTMTLELATDEHARLVERSRAAGVPPEEFLRGLI
jgi:ribonuclease HI